MPSLLPSTPAEADATLDGTTAATTTTAAMEAVVVLTVAAADTNCMIASNAMVAVSAMPTRDGLVEAVGLVTETVMVAPVGTRGAMTICGRSPSARSPALDQTKRRETSPHPKRE
eukprot:1259947-Rhodomonas_salina.1